MSLKSKIEAVIYASEEPVTLAQLVILLSEEAQAELDALAARQADLFVGSAQDAEPASPNADPPAEMGASPEDSEPADESAAEPAIDPAPENAESSDTPSADGDRLSDQETASADASGPVATPIPSAETASDPAERRQARERERALREYLRGVVDTLMREYAESDRGLEIREVAGGFRFGTKPEYHDAVRGFVKSLKPALKLSLQALETLAVVAYKQPVTAAEISEIRGVDSAGVLGGLLTRKLIQTAGRKQVIGRPMLYKTTKEFLVRFGLRDIQELPSMEEFERMAGELAEQEDLPMEGTENIIERANVRGDAEHIRETNQATGSDEDASSPAGEAGEAPSKSQGPSVEEDGRKPAPPQVGHDVSADAQGSPRSEAEPPTSGQEPV